MLRFGRVASASISRHARQKSTTKVTMDPETFAITSRWFVAPKVKQTAQKVGIHNINPRFA
jgi:hypothetical protein